MATSGQLNTNTAYDSYFWVKWSQTGDQDIPNNRTQIAWSCGVYCGHKFYSNAIKMSAVSINGTQVYGGGTYSNYSQGDHTIASGTMWIGHNADGTKTFSISSFTGWLYSNYNYSSNGGSYSLNTIPRQATLTSAPDFKDTDLPTIKYSNPAGNSVDKIEICIADNRAYNGYTAYRTLDRTGNLSFTFPQEDVDALKYLTINTLNISFVLRTTIAGKYYYSVAYKTFTITENDTTKPTVSMDVSLNNSLLPSAFDGMYIQGKSKVDVALSAEGQYGATIERYSAQVDGKTYIEQDFTSDVIQNSGNVDIIGYAKDSRGFTGSASQTVNVIEYSKPLVVPVGNENAILCYRSDGNGNRIGNSTSVWVKAKRFYHSVEGKNTCALQYRVKPATDLWTSKHQWNGLLYDDTQSDEYIGLIPDEVFDLKTSYTVQIMAIDDIGEYDLKTFEVPTQDVALHLGKGGKNVSIGTYCDYSEERTFYSEWKAIFGGGVCVGDSNTTLKDYILQVINGGG